MILGGGFEPQYFPRGGELSLPPSLGQDTDAVIYSSLIILLYKHLILFELGDCKQISLGRSTFLKNTLNHNFKFSIFHLIKNI